MKERLSIVKEEQFEENGRYFDFVDTYVSRQKESESQKVCISSGAENAIKSRKCTNCGDSLIKEKPEVQDLFQNKSRILANKHFDIVDVHENHFKIKTGEPDMVNRNSFDSISKILFNMGQRAALHQYDGNQRNWLFIECDGGIYSVDKLVFNVLRGGRCNECIYGYDNFLEHRCHVLHYSKYSYEFGWIFLLHVEMNAYKVFFELNWEIILKNICMKLGYSSPKSLEFARRCSDHHKTWSMLEIMYIAVEDELLVPFVRHCKAENKDITVENYWLWSDTLVNPNYIFIHK